MRRVGSVEITKYDLAARCTVCHKSLIYSGHIRLAMWKEMLKAFIKKHRDCASGH